MCRDKEHGDTPRGRDIQTLVYTGNALRASRVKSQRCKIRKHAVTQVGARQCEEAHKGDEWESGWWGVNIRRRWCRMKSKRQCEVTVCLLLTKPCSPKLNLNLAHARGFIPKRLSAIFIFPPPSYCFVIFPPPFFFLPPPLSLSLSAPLSVSPSTPTRRLITLLSIFACPCHSLCDTAVARRNQIRWSAWHRCSLDFVSVSSKGKRGADSRKPSSFMQKRLPSKKNKTKNKTKQKRNDVPGLTPDPSAEGKFIVPFLLFVHQRYFYIFHLYFTSFLSLKCYKDLTLEMFFPSYSCFSHTLRGGHRFPLMSLLPH